VPAIGDVRLPHAGHSYPKGSRITQYFLPPQLGQMNPSGHLLSAKYSQQAASEENRRRNSCKVLGNPGRAMK